MHIENDETQGMAAASTMSLNKTPSFAYSQILNRVLTSLSRWGCLWFSGRELRSTQEYQIMGFILFHQLKDTNVCWVQMNRVKVKLNVCRHYFHRQQQLKTAVVTSARHLQCAFPLSMRTGIRNMLEDKLCVVHSTKMLFLKEEEEEGQAQKRKVAESNSEWLKGKYNRQKGPF